MINSFISRFANIYWKLNYESKIQKTNKLFEHAFIAYQSVERDITQTR